MNVSSDEAGARGWKLDVLDDEREIVIRRIVDQEAVVDVLLYAFGLVTGGNQWARRPDGSSVALFDNIYTASNLKLNKKIDCKYNFQKDYIVNGGKNT